MAKRTLLDHLNHEIRSPMTVIVGMTDLLLLSELSDDQRQCLKTMKQAVDALLRLMNDVVDYSKLESGSLAWSATEFELEAALGEAVESLASGDHGPPIVLALDIAAEVPRRVVTDRERLKQVAINLSRSCVKSRDETRLRLRVGLESRAPDQAVLVCGLGDARAAFAPHGRGDEEAEVVPPHEWAERGFGGHGFALAVAAGLVARLGGRLWAPAKRPDAANFHFTARVGLAGEASRNQVRPARVTVEGQGRSKRLRVLLAEDTPANQKLIAMLLSQRGHSVVLAANGQEALDAYARERFDVVLLDLEMPTMSGWEAAEQMRQFDSAGQRPAVPIVALTAHGRDGDPGLADAGMDAIVHKPFDVARLCQVVESVAGAGVAAEPPSGGAGASDAIIDYRSSLARLGGSIDLFDDMAGFFLEDAPLLLREMQSALSRGNGPALQRAAHSLKGLAANFGAHGAVESAAQLERLARDGPLSAAGQPLERLADDVACLTRALEAQRTLHEVARQPDGRGSQS